ncbi:MAG TPA: hypothetical protein DER64_19260, partial [Planctomycetaceae bacterium]|nr:hypothetical protein [Planctomycetaceae bacterium]
GKRRLFWTLTRNAGSNASALRLGRDDRVIRQGEHPRDAVSDDIEVLSRCHSKIYQVVKERPPPAVSEEIPELQTTAVGHVRRSPGDRQASQLLFDR